MAFAWCAKENLQGISALQGTAFVYKHNKKMNTKRECFYAQNGSVYQLWGITAFYAEVIIYKKQKKNKTPPQKNQQQWDITESHHS